MFPNKETELFLIEVDSFFVARIMNNFKRRMFDKDKRIRNNNGMRSQAVKYSVFHKNKLFRPKIYIDIGVIF